MLIRTVIVSGMRSSTTGSGFVADSNSSATTVVNCNDTDNDRLTDGERIYVIDPREENIYGG